MADASMGVRAKRKRGRPRKDSNLMSREGTLENASFMKTSHQGPGPGPGPGPELLYPKKSEELVEKNITNEGMVGSMVYGVVEGSFDAGYLISVRIGNNLAPFRGVVFEPRKVVAVTPANDVAPQAKMYERREMQQQQQQHDNNINNASLNHQVEIPLQQSTMCMSNQQQFPHPNLRMVEEDEVMQAFEVSTSSGKNSLATTSINGKESMMNMNEELHQPVVHFDQIQQEMKTHDHQMPNLYYNENIFSDANSRAAAASPNLNLELAEKQESAINYTVMKNPNIGYHQALVAGNPLLLPPDLSLSAMADCDCDCELMMDPNSNSNPNPSSKPKTPPNCTNDDADAIDFLLTNAIQQTTNH